MEARQSAWPAPLAIFCQGSVIRTELKRSSRLPFCNSLSYFLHLRQQAPAENVLLVSDADNNQRMKKVEMTLGRIMKVMVGTFNSMAGSEPSPLKDSTMLELPLVHVCVKAPLLQAPHTLFVPVWLFQMNIKKSCIYLPDLCSLLFALRIPGLAEHWRGFILHDS